MSQLKRQVLLTGASSGIGRAIGRKLLQEGHTVIGLSRDVSQFTVSHPQFCAYQLDLSQLASLPQQLKLIQQAHPQLDTLVFAAGAGLFGSLEEFSFAQIEHLMTLNFTSNALLTRVMLPELKKRGRADLVYIGSEAALQGKRKGTIYCASKFALRGFTQALREECAKSKVRVALINPGMVNTPFFNPLNFAPGDAAGQFISAADVAAAVSFVLTSASTIVIDELNLSPLQKVIQFKKS